LSAWSGAIKAIILAAGQGRRLLPLTADRPKCLIDLSGRSLLLWQLEALSLAGVTEALIVTGFGADKVEAAIAEGAPAGMRVRSFFNPFYAQADNLATCWMVRQEFAGGCLILNGDTLIEPEIARRLLAAPAAPITVTVDRKDAYDADDMKVSARGSQLQAIGKTLTAAETNAESIGFLRFEAEGAALFTAEIEQTMRSPDGLGKWYLSAIHRIAQGSPSVHITSIEGLEWGEMDFPADYTSNTAMTAAWNQRWASGLHRPLHAATG